MFAYDSLYTVVYLFAYFDTDNVELAIFIHTYEVKATISGKEIRAILSAAYISRKP